MRKAVISIPSNIAEGCSRKSNLETIQFLFIATASLSELETQIIIADKLGYVSDTEKTLTHLSKIKMMIFGLIKSYKMK